MIYKIGSPVGIDYYVQQLQQYLYDYLKTKWTLTDSTAGTVYDSYGRVYRLMMKDYGTVPEAFTGGTDYKEVFFDDTRAALSFFDVGDVIKNDTTNTMTANVSLYFQVQLNIIKPSVYRLDEDARLDVKNFIDGNGMGFFVKAIATGEKEVFKNYSGYRKKAGTKYTDMHPFHCFRIDLLLPNYPTNLPHCTIIT